MLPAVFDHNSQNNQIVAEVIGRSNDEEEVGMDWFQVYWARKREKYFP